MAEARAYDLWRELMRADAGGPVRYAHFGTIAMHISLGCRETKLFFCTFPPETIGAVARRETIPFETIGAVARRETIPFETIGVIFDAKLLLCTFPPETIPFETIAMLIPFETIAMQLCLSYGKVFTTPSRRTFYREGLHNALAPHIL